MKILLIISVILWILCGILGLMATWHSARKRWYKNFKEEYWNDPCETALHFLLIISPLIIIFGLISLILARLFVIKCPEDFTFYFKIPKEDERTKSII